MSTHPRVRQVCGDRLDPSPPGRNRESPGVSAPDDACPAIGVVVAMESRMFREGVASLLAAEDDFRVLGAGSSVTETIGLCANLKPHVLVLGILAAGPRDLSAITAVRLASPDTGILVLAPHGRDRCQQLNPAASLNVADPGAAAPALRCLPGALTRGALAALDADADPATLFAAVRAVARGERWGATEPAPVRVNGRTLSPQELKVARLVGQGASNKEIASALAISDLTVKKHLGSIFQKLELHDRLQLGLRVARNPAEFDGEPSVA